jgi:hypothetical protein
MTSRFIIDGVGRDVGIVDAKRKRVAIFHGMDAAQLKWRLERCVGRLNSGVDTPTGYVWDDLPQGWGTDEGES